MNSERTHDIHALYEMNQGDLFEKYPNFRDSTDSEAPIFRCMFLKIHKRIPSDYEQHIDQLTEQYRLA